MQDLAEGTFRLIEGGGGDDGGAGGDDEDRDAAPDWVTHELARELWRDLMPTLRARKQFIPLFTVELGRYCNAFADYVCARRSMADEGGPVTRSSKKVAMLSQHWVVANRAHETLLRLAADLGLNPVAQLRLAGVQLDLFDQPAAGGGGSTPGSRFAAFRKA